MQKYKSRKDVPDKYKWDLTAFFKSEKDYKSQFLDAQERIKEIKSYIGCTKDANRLYEFLKFDTETEAIIENLYVYSHLINDEELGNSKNMARKSQAEDLMNSYAVSVSFFNPELLELSKEEYNQLFEKNAKLKEYRATLDRIYRKKEHILSQKEEEIIAELNSAMNHFDDLSSTMLNAEHNYGTVTINGEEEKITPTNLRLLLKNEDQLIREDARKKYNETLGQYGATSAQLLNSFVKGSIANSKLHNYPSAWDEVLFQNNIPNKVYESLVSTVESNTNVLQKYLCLFKKVMGLKELHQYDLGLELAKSKREYTIEEAQELTLKALEPLGSEYLKHYKKIYDNHYIDYAQYPGKCSGGYSFSTMVRMSSFTCSKLRMTASLTFSSMYLLRILSSLPLMPG